MLGLIEYYSSLTLHGSRRSDVQDQGSNHKQGLAMFSGQSSNTTLLSPHGLSRDRAIQEQQTLNKV